MSHLNVVHDRAMMCGGEPDHSWLQWEFVKHLWDGRWRTSEKEGEKHIAIMELNHQMCIFGKIPLISMDVVTQQVRQTHQLPSKDRQNWQRFRIQLAEKLIKCGIECLDWTRDSRPGI